ncbi:hypothetical protein FDA52_12540 [Clostridium botulinum]|nr:hypothetical protein [Clostridium botulinum]
MGDIKKNVSIKINLSKKEIIDKISNMDYKRMEEKVALYKRYESLNLFHELFYIACNKSCNKEEEIYNLFVQLTRDFLDSCKVHQINEQSSWGIHIDTYEKLNQIIKTETSSYK